MPELPEVQTIVNDLIAENLIGREIVGINIRWLKIIAEPAAEIFRHQVQNRAISAVSRRGKFIRIDLQPPKILFVHLRMSGRLSVTAADSPLSKHEHLIFVLNDGRHLRYHDTRKFGRFWLVDQPDKVIGALGIEPLGPDFRLGSFAEKLRNRHRQLKPLLLDQSVVAGLGNIYVDESLWAARLHPARLADSLDEEEIRALFRAIPKVLKQGLRNQGTSLGNGQGNFQSAGKRRGRNQEALKVFHRTGQPCPVCGTKIERIIIGQRSTHICPHCQPFH